MTELPRISWDELAAVVREDVEQPLRQIVQSVNNAAAGELISGSEELVRDALDELRTCLFQKALQLRVDAIERELPTPVETHRSKNKRHKGGRTTHFANWIRWSF